MKKIQFLFAAVVLLVYSGCVPQPDACFTMPSQIVDQGEDVAFTNCSVSGTGYEWNFGDGTFSNEYEPVHTYPAPNDYLIILTVTGKKYASVEDAFSEIIRVGQRLLSTVEINQIPTLNPQGSPWDAGDAADLRIRLRREVAPNWDFISAELTNQPVPSVINLSFSRLILSPEVWTIELVDVDGTGEEIIGSWVTDLRTIPPGEGIISLTATDTDLVIRYVLE